MAYQAVDEIMTRCEKDGVEFWKAVQLEDCEENGISEEESWKQMTLMWTRMKESVEAYDPEAVSRSGLVGSEGSRWMYIGRMKSHYAEILCQRLSQMH